MDLVALVVVGTVLVVVVGLFAWSGARAAVGARARGPRRTITVLPLGLLEGLREPAALRAPFALTARGELVDVGQVWLGAFRGGEVALADLHVRLERGQPPVAHTVVTVEVEHRWPWTRLRTVGAMAVDVEPTVAGSTLEGAGGPWVLEGQDPDLAAALAAPELRAWLGRIGHPVVVEFTPRHLLVAVPQRLADDELATLVEIAVGVVDHVPAAVRTALLPPEPGEESAGGTPEDAEDS